MFLSDLLCDGAVNPSLRYAVKDHSLSPFRATAAVTARPMPDSSVSSCVLNILSSFSNSLDLVTKLRENRCKRRMIKRRNRDVELEEERLSKSLKRGPDEIGREYQKNVFAAGPQFDIGDGMRPAQVTIKIGSSNTSSSHRPDVTCRDHD